MEDQQQTYTYLEIDGDFKMRELDHGDLEQFNTLSRSLLMNFFRQDGSRKRSNTRNVLFWKKLMSSDGFTRINWHL